MDMTEEIKQNIKVITDSYLMGLKEGKERITSDINNMESHEILSFLFHKFSTSDIDADLNKLGLELLLKDAAEELSDLDEIMSQ